jgi:hypothetical protein
MASLSSLIDFSTRSKSLRVTLRPAIFLPIHLRAAVAASRTTGLRALSSRTVQVMTGNFIC